MLKPINLGWKQIQPKNQFDLATFILLGGECITNCENKLFFVINTRKHSKVTTGRLKPRPLDAKSNTLTTRLCHP